MEAHRLTQHADPASAQRIGRQPRTMVDGDATLRRCTGGISEVHARQRIHQQCHIAHAATHRPRRVLRHGDRDDAATTHHADRGLQPDQSRHCSRTDDAAVGLGTHADGGETRGDRRSRPRTRTTRITVQHVRITGLTTPGTPTGDRVIRAEVGPLREVRLAENHRTCLPQARDEERIGLRAVLGERQGPRRVDEADDVDVVLQEYRDAVQRSTDLADGPLTVALGGLGQRGRIEFDHRIEGRPVVIHCSDARKVSARQLDRRQPSVGKPLSGLGHRQFDDIDHSSLDRHHGRGCGTAGKTERGDHAGQGSCIWHGGTLRWTGPQLNGQRTVDRRRTGCEGVPRQRSTRTHGLAGT